MGIDSPAPFSQRHWQSPSDAPLPLFLRRWFPPGSAGGAPPDFLPAIVYDFGGKFDRSFNQSASEGAEKFKKDTGIAFREFEITNAAQREQVMTQSAKRGATIIVAVGFTQASAVEKVARQFPNVKFTIIDAVVDLPNVQSINFREQESSFLCGMAAALASKTGKIGFVGGMDIPLIRKFALGYVEGAKYVNPPHRGVSKHDRHHARRVGRSDQGRRAREEPVRPRRRRGFPRRRRHGHRRDAGGEGRRASSASAATATRITCIPAACSPRR